MIGIGLNHGEINSSAAILKDGIFLAAAPEERFNRLKKSRDFPAKAVEYCLKVAGLKLNDCDYVAQAWNPGAGWHKHQNLFNDLRTRREGYFYSLPDNLLNLTDTRGSSNDWVQMSYPNSFLPPVYFVQHHRCHAANAFFLSELEEAAILTSDFRGEFETASMSKGIGTNIEFLSSQILPDSLGMFYATFTELLGYRPDNDEWKVMALSAFDVNCQGFYEKIRKTVKLLDNGYFAMDQSYYKGIITDQPHLYTPALKELLGGKVGEPGEEVTEWHLQIAKAMQQVSEDIALNMIHKLHKLTKVDSLAVGGGFFMNSVLNGKILDKSPFKKIYVSHSPADVGNCFGAASFIAHCVKGEERVKTFNSSYLGPDFSNEQIKQTLIRRKIPFQHYEEWPAKAAEILSKGSVVAVMNGRMEFGERALGNRSILGDPRKADMKDKINSMIKYRESYRPFAPATLRHLTDNYFESSPDYDCPYMEKVIMVKKAHRNDLAAVTHVDGSARLQTVEEHQNPSFYSLIDHFGKLTGVPVVLNTSFNINGEPIVCTPDDALSTFFNSGLEHLFLSGYYVTKNNV